jgi:hypothetical protein
MKKYRERNRAELLPREAAERKRQRKLKPEQEQRRVRAYMVRREQRLTELAGRPRAMICDVCKEDGKTVFDHCHSSGNFRGWLCDRCNKTLGLVKDSPAILTGLAGYILASKMKDNECGAAQLQGQKEITVQGLRWSGAVISDS